MLNSGDKEACASIAAVPFVLTKQLETPHFVARLSPLARTSTNQVVKRIPATKDRQPDIRRHTQSQICEEISVQQMEPHDDHGGDQQEWPILEAI